MKYNLIHDDHDLLVVTPDYFRNYEDAIKRNYPNHEIEVSRLPSAGQAYLFNKQKLKEEYDRIASNSEN